MPCMQAGMRVHTPLLVGEGQIIWGVLPYHCLPSSFETGVSLMTVKPNLAASKLQACAHPFHEGGN